MRLTAHEDGWIYGIFCAERRDPAAAPGDLSAATASAGIARTKDLITWERLPDLKAPSQQRNRRTASRISSIGKYALYTRSQDGFINPGTGGGIGWALVETSAMRRSNWKKSSTSAHTTPSKRSRTARPPPDPNSAGMAAPGSRCTWLRFGFALCTLSLHDLT